MHTRLILDFPSDQQDAKTLRKRTRGPQISALPGCLSPAPWCRFQACLLARGESVAPSSSKLDGGLKRVYGGED
ncbi:hypothetical protein CKAH01_00882 [Colletotrichum kahawae]|uniref:Uncharacterized protein n=1 Tax=Colletotrichum kahawae TaxID=34407 RepID=A0AAD9YKG0_COLKA|nr:hypothetical protein CKAH01_00882 [Colletotrichum kahawae]